jgi:hypothetical protein
MKPDIASASEVAQGLLALSASEFWPRHYEREFLWTLGARWKDLPNKERQLIERRIIAGPAPFPDESKADHMRRKSLRAAVRLGWLQANGCALSKSTRQRLPGLRKADARWRPDFDRTADDSHESRSGWVRTEADPSDIADAPISEIIELAHSHSSRALGFFVEYRPFQGLIEAKPLRALMALSFEARHGRFPSKFWEQLVSHWPKCLSGKLCLKALDKSWHRFLKRHPSGAIFRRVLVFLV